MVENRSLTSAEHAVVVTKTAPSGVYDYFDFSLVPPCTRETYDLGDNGKRLDTLEQMGELELYFQDPAGQLWKSGNGAVTQAHSLPELGDDYAIKWKLSNKFMPLEACG
ncbi:hypothetical protein CG747_12600 [Streptomyces sp. CB02959]|nr:hypothetical protein CG747_12600 [Streptomyces sp. CB02959]